jgi:predicted outer membrane protein
MNRKTETGGFFRPIQAGQRAGRQVRAGVVLAICGLVVLLAAAGCRQYGDPNASGNAGGSKPQAQTAPNSSESPEPAPTRKTRWGPLSAADELLVAKVRLASLWEMPMAQEASKKASTKKVRQISKTIAGQHMYLDGQVRALAAKLKVKLPTQPNADQKKWMKDIRSRRGHAYDVTYVKWLRFAHGQIFALIGQVRGSTQNTLMRKFSEVANSYVLMHQQMLESTGLTTPKAFPPPPAVP